MEFTVNKVATIDALLDKYGFGEREDIYQDKHWYSFAGKFAKLTDAEVEALEFTLYNLYGEHLHLTPHKGLDMKDFADEFNEIGEEAFIKKYMER